MKIKKITLVALLAMGVSANVLADEKNVIGTIGHIDSVEQQIQAEQQKARLEQIQLERKMTQEALQENKFKDFMQQRERELRAEFSLREKELVGEINSLTQRINQMQKEKDDAMSAIKKSVKGIAESIYVTEISGKGANLIATIYYNEAIAKVAEGAELNESIVVKNVSTNGITITDSERDSFIPLTNEDYAFSQTFNKAAIEAMKAQTNGLSLRR